MTSTFKYFPKEGLRLFIDPKNNKCFDASVSATTVNNVVGKANTDVDPTLSNQSYTIQPGNSAPGVAAATSLMTSRAASEGYFDFGLISTSPEQYHDLSVDNDYSTSQLRQDKLVASSNTIAGSAFGYDKFVAHDHDIDHIDILCQFSKTEFVSEYNQDCQVGLVPKESSFMMWVWVSDELNGSSRPFYVASGIPEGSSQGDPEYGHRTLKFVDIGNNQFRLIGDCSIQVNVLGPYHTSNTRDPADTLQPQATFNYNQWYCLTYVRCARSGARSAINRQYWNDTTPDGTYVSGDWVTFSSGAFEHFDNEQNNGLGVTTLSFSQYDGTEVEDERSHERTRGYYRPGGGWNMAFYIDGVVHHSGAQLAHSVNFTDIGQPVSGNSSNYAGFRGKIGPIAVWQKALTGSEIQAAYQAFKYYFDQQGS